MTKDKKVASAASEHLQRSSDLERRIYVVDDDSDLRRSLELLLTSRRINVTLFASGMEFIGKLDALSPAPILLDIRMPHMDGAQVLAELSRRQNEWPVVILTGHGDIQVAVKFLKSGVQDFLEKPVSSKELLLAIEVAFDRLADHIIIEDRFADSKQRAAMLTPRELEIISRLAAGSSNKQVASELSISTRTVEMHRSNALRHLGVRTLVEAAALLANVRRQ